MAANVEDSVSSFVSLPQARFLLGPTELNFGPHFVFSCLCVQTGREEPISPLSTQLNVKLSGADTNAGRRASERLEKSGAEEKW